MLIMCYRFMLSAKCYQKFYLYEINPHKMKIAFLTARVGLVFLSYESIARTIETEIQSGHHSRNVTPYIVQFKQQYLVHYL